MSPLLGIFAAPAASSALDLAGQVVEGASTPFAALLEAATQCHDQSTNDGDPKLLDDAAPTDDESGGLIDLEGLFAALGF